MNYMKRILRAAVGTLFFASFMLFLFVTAVKFRVLNSDFWITALNKSGIYQQLSGEVVKFRSQIEGEVSKARRQGAPIPREINEILTIDQKLSESRLRELGETNVKRLFGFVNKEAEDLYLFLPIKEWNLPVKALGFVPFSELTAKTSLKDVLIGISKLGFSKQTPEEVEKTVRDFKNLRDELTKINLVWFGLLVLSLVLLAGHYFLGEGIVDRISGTAWTVMLSGFLAKLVGFGLVFGIGAILAKSKTMNPAVVLGAKSLASQFFALGEGIGLALGVLGLAGVIAVPKLIKQKELKAPEKKIGFVKRSILFVLGVILGFLILLLPLILAIAVFGGKGKGAGVPFSTGTKQSTTGGIYVSKSGWSMKQPSGWEALADKENEGFLKRPSETPTNWAAIEVKPLQRITEIDAGGHVKTIQDGITAQFKNSDIVEAAKESVVSGMKVFSAIFDYDTVISGTQMRLRARAVEFFPAKTGNGFLVISRAPVESWSKYEGAIKEAVATFTLPK